MTLPSPGLSSATSYPVSDLLSTYWPYAVGYLFAVIAPNLMPTVSGPLWRRWSRGPDTAEDDPLYDPFLGRVVGTIERALYVAAFLADEPTFVGIWLGLKVAGGWDRWSKNSPLKDGRKVAGRSIFNIMLIGSAVSVAWSWVAASMIRFLQWGDYQSAVLVGLVIVGAHLAFYGWLASKVNKKT